MPEDECETWMVFIDPEAGIKASSLIALSYRYHLPVRFKETCFGLLAESEHDVLGQFIDRLKGEHSYGLFFKRKGHSIGDTRLCAATFTTMGMRRAAEQLKYHNHS